MKRATAPRLIDADEALEIIGMQPKATSGHRGWELRRPLLRNTGLTPHPRGARIRWSRQECEQLREDLDAGRKAISAKGHVITLDNPKAA